MFDVRRILRTLRTKPARVAALTSVLVLAVVFGGAIRVRKASAQVAPLYNGVVLPPNFLQPTAPTQVFRPVSYLTNPPSVIPIDVGRQLFVDDFLIESTNLQRTGHRPVMYPGNPVLAGDLVRDMSGLAFPYSDGVWYDPDTKLFKMWYDGGGGNAIGYAYAADGKNWIKPNIADAAIPGSNLVMTIGGSRETTTVWRDALDPDPTRRYKAFVLFNIPFMHINFSGDGIHWSDSLANDMNTIVDRTTVFYNPFRRVWVESARNLVPLPATQTLPAHNARVRYYSESQDLSHWTDPTNVFWTGPDEFDPPYVPGGALPELYALDAVAYESVMVGLFSWFHPGPSYDPSYGPGPNLVELGVGFSRDGYQWVRPTRGFGADAFIPASNVDGAWNCCNTQSAGGGFLVVGDELWFYFSARTARKPANGNGSTGLATLRRDGFYSMDAPNFEGFLTTRALTFTGNHLFVNTAAAGGAVQAEILDTFGNVIAPFSRANSWVISADTTRSEITWAGADLSVLAGQPVKIRFYVTNGSLYSFWLTPSATGASFGYVAAGGPGLPGATDTVGTGVPQAGPPAPPPVSTPALSVGMTSPVNGSIVSGTVTLTASASGPLPVAGVVFRIDGGNVGTEIPSPPYQYIWNTVPWSNGAHTLTAIARDSSGATASTTISVTSQNGTGAPPPPPPPPVFAPPPPGVNLALGKSTVQSSTLAPASKAVDGNTDGDFTHGSVSHTGPDANAWWQVDLAGSSDLNAIVIWNRTDCCGARLSDYWVFVSDTPFGAADSPATLQSRAGTWSSHQTSTPNPVATISTATRGRYVRVQLGSTDYLQLAEVQVFGTIPPISISMAPTASTLTANGSQQFIATVLNASTSVAWSMNPAVGTLTSSGLYIAPPSIPFPITVTVTATSLADITKTASATVTLAPTLTPSGTNLALNKLATQSSTVAPASRAVDGNTDGLYLLGSTSHTLADPNAWWQVDLGSSAAINSIVIWNRTDCCMNRLRDYWVFVSDNPFGATDTPVTLQSRAGTWGSHQTIIPNPSSTLTVNSRGRYVRVQLSGTDYLQLAEVQVFGTIVGTNLALNKPATQSSTYTPASRAVDGNTDGAYLDGSVSHTLADPNAWWQVDLGSSANITSIAIWNRTDCCGTRLNDYWVFISETPFTAADTPATIQSRAGTWGSHQFTVPNPSVTIPANATGRYVRVQLSGANYLHLAEVQVLGTAVGSNLALNKTAAQSSTVAPASRAVDGNTDGAYVDGSVSHTLADPNAWWQVDLGASASVNSITLWNRTDCCVTRLSNYWIFVSDTPFGPADTPATLQNRAGTWSSFQTSPPSVSSTIPVNARGRFVRVQLSGTDYLHLAEVEVFGTP